MKMESRLRILLVLCIVTVIVVAIVLTGVAIFNGQQTPKPMKRDDLKECKLTADTLVPVLKDVCNKTHQNLVVQFASSDIVCNQAMTVNDTDSTPLVTYTIASDEARYTLVMVDPDAGKSSSDEQKFYLHWAITNIKGSDLRNGNVMNGTELEEYFGPHPPSGSGVHHYQFLLFKSPKEGEVILKEEMKRSNFDLQQFIDSNSICVLEDTFQFKVEVKEDSSEASL